MKSVQTERFYYDIKGEVSIFIGNASDCFYDENYEKLDKLVSDLISKTKSTANLQRCVRKIKGIFKDAKFRFDLPEHMERHNGFQKEWLYEEPIMQVLGFKFAKNVN